MGAAVASALLLGALNSASAASRHNVIVAVDGPAVSHIVVHKGQTLRTAVHKDNVNGIDIHVKSKHHVLHRVASYSFPEGKKATAVGFTKTLGPNGEVYKATRRGHATIVSEETRPTLGGVHTSWKHVIHVLVK